MKLILLFILICLIVLCVGIQRIKDKPNEIIDKGIQTANDWTIDSDDIQQIVDLVLEEVKKQQNNG